MVWFVFLLSAFVIILAAIRLAQFGDALALRTGLGGLFVGVIFIAASTSLPELLTTINAVGFGEVNLAAGNLLGSNMVNIAMLVVLDLIFRNKRILRTAALKHALSGSLACLLIGAAVFFNLAKLEVQIGWVGIDSLILVLLYLAAVWLLHQNQNHVSNSQEVREIPPGLPGMKTAIFGFLAASAALVYISPLLIQSSAEIARITGLGATFIGTTLLALVTSLPELVTTISAAKIGANDMAIGNLFGSNMFNMFALGLADFFYLPGRFLGVIDPAFVIVGMLGLILTLLGVVGNLIRLQRRFWLLEADAVLIAIVYMGGLWLLYQRGIHP